MADYYKMTLEELLKNPPADNKVDIAQYEAAVQFKVTQASIDAERRNFNLHELFKYYRGSASIFSATVIGSASAIIGLISSCAKPEGDAFHKACWFIFSLTPLASSIGAGILVQFFIYSGYFKWANAEVNQPRGNQNIDFGYADCLTKLTLGLFVFGFLGTTALLTIKYWS